MKLKHVFFIVSLSSLPLFTAAKSKTANVKMTETDSVSYAIGVEFARSVRENLSHLPGGPYNEAVLLEAFEKSFKNDTVTMLLKFPQTAEVIQSYMKKAQEAIALKAQEEGKAFLEKNKLRTEVKTTPSGLQYEVIKQGSGIKPNTTDKVKVHYHGTLIDGTVFDSSVERGEPATFELNKVIAGWTEGLQLMPIGSKYRFFIPSDLAYGARGTGGIPPYSTLIFDVELLDVARPTVQQPANNGAKFQFPAYQRVER